MDTSINGASIICRQLSAMDTTLKVSNNNTVPVARKGTSTRKYSRRASRSEYAFGRATRSTRISSPSQTLATRNIQAFAIEKAQAKMWKICKNVKQRCGHYRGRQSQPEKLYIAKRKSLKNKDFQVQKVVICWKPNSPFPNGSRSVRYYTSLKYRDLPLRRLL